MQTVASVGGSGTIRSTFDKNARKNVRFPFLFENDGEMLKVSVCWVFFSSCLAFFSFCYMFSLRRERWKGKISPPLQTVKMSSKAINFPQRILQNPYFKFFIKNVYFF